MTAMESREYVRALAVAGAIGLGVGAVSVAFLAAVHSLEHVLWHELPQALGHEEAPWWLVLSLPAIGGIFAALAIRMHGHGGHHPVDGFGGPPVTIDALPSALLAALSSLAFGVVLGPEAPLMAVGTALGIWSAGLLRASPQAIPLFTAAGTLAALGTILGNPLVGVVIIAEVLVGRAGAQVFKVLMPGIVAAGAGSLIFLGLGDFSGIGAVDLSIPNVPVPDTLSVADILWAPILGIVTAVLLIVVLRAMRSLRTRLERLPRLAMMPIAGVAVGGLAMLFSLTGQDPTALFFSGQAELPQIITWTSLGLLLSYAALKSLAYIVSGGAGFRGGLIFPMIAIAAALGTAMSLVLPGLDLAAGLAATIAAALAGGMRLPISGVVFAMLLMGSAGLVTTPVAIFSAAAAYVVAEYAHNREQAGQLPGTSTNAGAAASAG